MIANPRYKHLLKIGIVVMITAVIITAIYYFLFAPQLGAPFTHPIAPLN